MNSWFVPATSIHSGYAAFKDDNENPFKATGLLNKNFKIDYALLGDKIARDHSPTGQVDN